MAAEFTPPERYVDETDAEYLLRVKRAKYRFERASRGPASSLKYGKRTDREAEEKGDRPIPGIMIPGKKGELFIPASQKDSPIKREFDRSQRMSYEQAFAHYRRQGYTEQEAKRYAGELLDAYSKREITREEIEEISRRRRAPAETVIETPEAVQTFPGLLVRRGSGGGARKGSEVAREFLNAERRVARDIADQRREQDKQGRGLPKVLTRTGPSVFAEEAGTFEPMAPGRERRFTRAPKPAQGMTRAQAKAMKEANREARRQQQQEYRYQRFKANYGPGVDLDERNRELRQEFESKVAERAESEAAKQRIKEFTEAFEKRMGRKLLSEERVVVQRDGSLKLVVSPRGGRRPMAGLGAFDRTTQVLTFATVAALGIGAFLIYRSIQEEKKGK